MLLVIILAESKISDEEKLRLQKEDEIKVILINSQINFQQNRDNNVILMQDDLHFNHRVKIGGISEKCMRVGAIPDLY